MSSMGHPIKQQINQTTFCKERKKERKNEMKSEMTDKG